MILADIWQVPAAFRCCRTLEAATDIVSYPPLLPHTAVSGPGSAAGGTAAAR